jgi:cystathionine beta-lyase/cystathionine gamma-synthase
MNWESQKESPAMNTSLVHAGEMKNPFGAINLPIFQSANYRAAEAQSYESVTYLRLNNTPNHQVVHAKLAALEKTEAALVTASGMAAISGALLGLLKQGDHLLAHRCLYGGTHSFLTEDLPDFGIRHSFVDAAQPDTWKATLRPETRLFYVESMTNPLLEVAELEQVVQFCRQHNLLAVIDSTLATPFNFRPAEMGFDLVLHSATKYMNGHSDIVAGAICGPNHLLKPIRHRFNHLGGSLDPNSLFLLHRGLKTMALRVRQQNATAQSMAEWLGQLPEVTKVNYAGLPDHPGHARAQRWFAGFGGVLSFELNIPVQPVLDGLQLFAQAPSLGGVESLVTRPCTTSHLGMPKSDREAIGISDGLVRMAVGIEDFEDLRDDFAQALQKAKSRELGLAPMPVG